MASEGHHDIVGAALRGRPLLPVPSNFEDDGTVTNGVATECHPYNVLDPLQAAGEEDEDSEYDSNES